MVIGPPWPVRPKSSEHFPYYMLMKLQTEKCPLLLMTLMTMTTTTTTLLDGEIGEDFPYYKSKSLQVRKITPDLDGRALH